MEKFLIIRLDGQCGITPFIIIAEGKAEFEARLRIIVKNDSLRGGGVYAEVYRLGDKDFLEYIKCYSFDGKDIYECNYFVPSYRSFKNFIDKSCIPLLKL